ncbi:MAG: hypothetical protein DRO88_05280 [Promethearchaeia archaeon]|nr:MAG: hypothetical protein DRO88_05280 [Candidatus Lokiarchaeia archaeon]
MPSKKITIIRLTTRLFPDPNAGGPAKYAFDLSNFVNNHHFEMVNISSNPNQEKTKYQKISSNFEIHRLPVKGLDMNSNSKWNQIWFSLRFTAYAIISILRIHRKKRIALIHADSPAITGVVCLFFNLLCRIPFVYTYHGVDFKFRFEIFLYKLTNTKTSKIIIVSRRIQEYFQYLGWNFGSKLEYIPLGIKIPEKPYHYTTLNDKDVKAKIISHLNLSPYIKSDDKIILYVGRMIFEQKVQGMIDFLAAFEKFLFSFPEPERSYYKLLIIGDGIYRSKLEIAYQNCTQKSNVFLLGYRSNLEDFYAIADLTVLVSYVEGFPNVILESLASSVPCLCSSVGEMKEMTGPAGFIVEPGNRDQMISCLQDFFNPKRDRKILAQQAFNWVKSHFDWKSIAKKYQQLYLECIYDE